jgi:hypothetical protein
MPFLLNLETRSISEVFKTEPFVWISIIMDIKVLTAWHYELEYEYKNIRCLWNRDTNCIITQTRDEAWDIEYSTRESESFSFVWGPPCPIVFPKFNLVRQDALSHHQWMDLLKTSDLNSEYYNQIHRSISI